MDIPDDEAVREKAYQRYKKKEVFGTPSVVVRQDFVRTLVTEGVTFGEDLLSGVDNLMHAGLNGDDFGRAALGLFEAAMPGTFSWHQLSAKDPLCTIERSDYSHPPINAERSTDSVDFNEVYHADCAKNDYVHVNASDSIKHPLNMAFHRFASVAGSYISLRQPDLTIVFGTAEEAFTFFNRTGKICLYLNNMITSFMKKSANCAEFVAKSKSISLKAFPTYTTEHNNLILITSNPNVIKHRAKFKCSIFAAAADMNRYKFDLTNASHVRVAKYEKDSVRIIAYDANKQCKTFTLAATTSDGFVTWYDMLKDDMIWNSKSKWWKDYSADLSAINYFGAKFIRDEREWNPLLQPVNNLPVDGYATEPVSWKPCVGSDMIPIPGSPAIISLTHYGLEVWQIIAPFSVWFIPKTNTVEPITCLGSVYADQQGLKASIMFANGSAYMHNLSPAQLSVFSELKCIGKPTIDAVYCGWRIATTGYNRDLSPFNLPFSMQNQVNDGTRFVPMAHSVIVATLLTSQMTKLAIVNYKAMIANDVVSDLPALTQVDYDFASDDESFAADDLAEDLYYEEGEIKILKGLGGLTAAAALSVLADADSLQHDPTARAVSSPEDDDEYVYQPYSLASPSYVPLPELGKRNRDQFD